VLSAFAQRIPGTIYPVTSKLFEMSKQMNEKNDREEFIVEEDLYGTHSDHVPVYSEPVQV
jgi:hypothetical protein